MNPAPPILSFLRHNTSPFTPPTLPTLEGGELAAGLDRPLMRTVDTKENDKNVPGK